jgi:hypothetical protein
MIQSFSCVTILLKFENCMKKIVLTVANFLNKTIEDWIKLFSLAQKYL